MAGTRHQMLKRVAGELADVKGVSANIEEGKAMMYTEMPGQIGRFSLLSVWGGTATKNNIESPVSPQQSSSLL